MHIGELAKRAGVNIQTVRFYERRELLPEPPRTESGYRQYGTEELKRLSFIRQAKALGFSLGEIQDIIRSRGRGQCPCTNVIAMAERHLANISQQIDKLDKFKQELTRAVRSWKRAGRRTLSSEAICVLIERTMEANQKPRRGK